MPPPVLFIPGFMQPASAWAAVAERLDQPTVLLEQREHSFEGRLAEIAAAGEGALLVGYSLGGRLALRAALREPARYAGLVTVGATAGIEETAARTARADRGRRLDLGAPAAVRRPVRGAHRGPAIRAARPGPAGARPLAADRRSGRARARLARVAHFRVARAGDRR